MTTRDIIKAGKKMLSPYKIISESADPRMVKELKDGGLKIKPVKKFAGSVVAGIDFMKSCQKIYVTSRSVNAIKELKNYTYQQDSTGKWLNEPVDDFNHILDGVRYVCLEELMGKHSKKTGVPSGTFR